MQRLLARLELLKNLMFLQEQPLITQQVPHLIPYAEQYPRIAELIALLARHGYSDAQQLIEQFIQSQRGLQSRDAAELALLRLELSQLEAQLTALIEQQTEHQLRIEDYHRQQQRELGPLIEQVLAQRELEAKYALLLARLPLERQQALLRQQQRRLAEEIARLQQASEQAERDAEQQNQSQQQQYQDRQQDSQQYWQQHDQDAKHLELSDAETQRLKQCYRKACKLAHPDLVPDEFKQQAHEMMVALNQARDAADLPELERLLTALEQQDWTVGGSRLSNIEQLRQRIQQLQQTINEQQLANQSLMSDPDLAGILDIDDLDTHFAQQQAELQALLAELIEQTRQQQQQLAAGQAELAAIDRDQAGTEPQP